MADISKITLPTGTTYNIKDAQARSDIATIIDSLAGGISFIGETTTALVDGSTTNPITINGESRTVIAGNMVFNGNKEFLWDGTKWTEMGNLDALGEFAYVDAGNVQVTPHGTVSQPTFTGTSSTVTITATDNTSGNYQPKGTVSQPTFTGSTSTFTGTAQPTGSIQAHPTFTEKDYAVKVLNSQQGTYYDYTPAGTVSQPTFTGTATESTGTFTPSGTVTVTTNGTTNKTATVSTTSGTATYTPAGTISAPAFTGASMTSTGSFTPSGSVSLTNTNQTTTVSKASSGTATYTPEGTVAAPTISVATAGATTTVNSITAVGTLPSLTTTVENENLTLGWSAGTLPTKGANQTVKTGDAAYSASAPAFTGTGARLVTGNISVPSSASFSGTAGSVSVSGTTTGSVAAPTFTGTGVRLVTGNIPVPNTYTATFTGTEDDITVTGTPSGTVSQPVFAGTAITKLVAKGVEKTDLINTSLELNGISISVSGKPSGTVSQPTFTGTKAQISGTVTPSGTVSQPTFTGTQESWEVNPGAPS